MTTSQTSHEYMNDFLYFVLRPDRSKGERALLYCSGVNISRFTPIGKGRHGIGTNPAMRGLQLVNIGVRDLALSRGATPRRLRGNDCVGIAPTDDVWYTEILLIENAPDALTGKVIDYCVLNLLRKVFKAVMLEEVVIPDQLPSPEELQDFLTTQCILHAL